MGVFICFLLDDKLFKKTFNLVTFAWHVLSFIFVSLYSNDQYHFQFILYFLLNIYLRAESAKKQTTKFTSAKLTKISFV